MSDERGSGGHPAVGGPFPRFRRQVDVDAATFGVTFADALVAGDGARAVGAALRARGNGMSVATICARIVAPSLYVIGDMWERRELSVADEHLATIICHRVLAVLHSTMRGPPPGSRAHVMLATPEGQRHGLGLRMVADVLEGAGFDVTHLGADVPSQALRHAVQRHQPDVVGLSLTTAEGERSLEQAMAAVAAVKPDVLFLLGGQAVPERLVRERVAYGGDVDAVVATLQRLLETGAGAPPSGERFRPRLSVIQPRGVASDEERLERAAADIGEVAREHARLAERYRRLTFEDVLSGLPNGRAFEDRFHELAEAHDPSRSGLPLAVLLLDIDHMKAINDEHGHDAGDRALQRVAVALRSHVREHDLPARLGGDRFALLLPGIEPPDALLVAARIQDAVRAGSELPQITVSGAVAGFDGDRRRTLIRADQALYEAKRGERDVVTLAV